MSSERAAKAKAKARNLAYQKQFNLPEDELLIDEFLCALQHKILLQGKLYISQNFACFYANIFGSETIKILPASDITGVQLAKILFIPNSIKVFLTYETYFFASFLHRDDAYRLLTKISRGESIAHMGSYATAESPEVEDDAASQGYEDDADGAPSHRRNGSNASNGSSGARSPPAAGGSKVRHASLLSDHANSLQVDNKLKRQESLREAQRNLKKKEDSDDSDESPSDDDEPPRRPAANGRAAPVAAAAAAPVKANGKAAAARKPSESDLEPPVTARGAPATARGAPAPSPKKGRGRNRSDSESSASSRSDSDSPPPPPKRKGREQPPQQQPEPSPTTKAAAKKPASVPAPASPPSPAAPTAAEEFLAASSNASFVLPRTGRIKQARFYAFDFKVPDPAVIELQTKHFKNKQLGLDAPEVKRRLIYQGAMKRQGGWSIVDRWCFLFHDNFLFTEFDEKKGVHTNFGVKQRIDLLHLVVDMRPVSFQAEELKKTKLPNAFRLLDNNPDGLPCQYICSTLTAQEKYDWGRRFTEAISRWHANPASKSTFDRRKVGWYTQFVRGLLPHAVISKDLTLIENLLRTPQKDNISDVDQEGFTLLHLCVLNNTPELIPLLLQNGADLRIKDGDEYTPLHLAVVMGNLACVRALMASKSMDVSVWHPIGHKESKVLRDRSALWLAALTNYKDPPLADALMRILIASVSAMPNFLDERSEKNDMTLLDYCCFNDGMDRVAATLIELGATVDLVNLDGLTPLSQACRAGNVRMATLLLQAGAQPNLRNKQGQNSSLFYCRGGSGLDCARELVSYGARWAEMKNRENVRVRDLFPSSSQQSFLKSAEETWSSQKPSVIENSTEPMKPPANAMPQNNRHDFESCCLCQLEFTLVNKRDYCRRCGWNICAPCSSKRMAFVSSSKGKSKNSNGSGSAKERVCDGCYNLVSHRKKMVGARVAASKKAADADAGEDSDDPMAAFRKKKPAAKAAGSDEDDDDPRPAKKRTEPSGFKSIKRLDVDSDDDSDRASAASHSDSDDSADERAAAKAKAAAKGGKGGDASAAAAPSLGGRMSSFFSSKKKEDPVAAAKAEAAKHAAASKQKGRDSEEDDDDFDKKKGKSPAKGKAAATAAAAGKKGRAPDTDDDDEPPPSTARGRAAAAAAASAAPSRRARGQSSDEEDVSSHTDSDDMTEDPNKKKPNFLQRGLKSAQGAVKSAGGAVGGAVKSAGGAMGGAMSSVARGVTKFAHTVQEKVTAVAVPVSGPGDEDEDEDPQAVARARRKEAARMRLRAKYGQRDQEEEEEAELDDRPTPKGGASSKAASTAAKMSDAKRQAHRNQDLLYQMEDRGAEVEEGGREFHSLVGQLKDKAKKGKI